MEQASREFDYSTPAPGLGVLRLQRPTRRNALHLALVHDLHRLFDQILADASLRALVLYGEGGHFCAGLDLKAWVEGKDFDKAQVLQAMRLQQTFAGLIQRLRASDAAVIAAVDGVAVGAGMALTLAADVRFGTARTQFHIGAVRIGLTAGECGISYHLPRLIGAGRAFELMLTGRPMPADEALQAGLLSGLVPPEQLLARALECAQQIVANPPYSTAHTKRLMWQNIDAPSLAAALELENHAQVLGLMTQDFDAAVQSFVQKKAPTGSAGVAPVQS